MATIVTRAGKGSPLTHNEVDSNFTNLNTDKVELTGTSPVSISVNTAGNALRVTQTGTGNALLVEDDTNPDSTPTVIDAEGRVIAGSTGNFGGYQFQSLTTTGANFNAMRFSNDAFGTNVRFDKSRSTTIGGLGAVASGDVVGQLVFRGDDGASYITSAQIFAAIDGTPGTNDMPGRLVFSTTADGASSPTDRMRITSAGNVLVGRTYTGNEKIGIGGPTNTYSTATSASSIFDDTTVSSAQTNAFTSFLTYISTQAASFTLANLTHYKASQFTIGAGSIVTNQYGFFADHLIGATNNYGFFSNIASSANRFNFYAAGTAPNYFAGIVGVGGTASSGTTLRIGGSLTGAVNGFGVYNNQAIQSDVTTTAQIFTTYVSTAAASFTLGSIFHFNASLNTIGAGSSVTNQYGYVASSSLVGATNNYGFFGNIASAANRWNFYAAGTAANYFAGNCFIGATTGDQALNVNGAVRVAATTTANQTSAATMDFTGGAMRFLVWGASGVQGTFSWWTGSGALGATQRLTLNGSGNLGLATSTFGTSATNTFSVFTGTAPTTGVADTVQFYSSDLSAGNTIPSYYTEGTNVGTGTPTADRTIAVRFNGTVYYLLASTIP